jgi:uracil-DNA glycosylase
VLVVGALAARRLLGLKSLDECVGRRYPLGEAIAVPLPHPSGASGWLNAPANRERLQGALAVVREELSRAGAG